MYLFLLPLIAVILIVLPIFLAIKRNYTGKKAKNAFITNLCAFAGVAIVAFLVPMTGFAAEATTAVADIGISRGFGYLAAALATGMSSIGCGIAVAAAAPAAIGAVSEDPKSFVKSLIFVALGEGVAIYGILISILIINSLPAVA